jgi:hypothetical protein
LLDSSGVARRWRGVVAGMLIPAAAITGAT